MTPDNAPYKVRWQATHVQFDAAGAATEAMLVASRVRAGIKVLTLRDQSGYVFNVEAAQWEVI